MHLETQRETETCFHIFLFAWFLSFKSPASLEGIFDDASSHAFIK